jgi:excinuclease ABC subunit C
MATRRSSKRISDNNQSSSEAPSSQRLVALRGRIADMPTSPGVYLMKDHQNVVIYVGKADNLRNRLRTYFGKSSDTRFFVSLLSKVLYDIEVVVTQTGGEALLLENQLIKTHQPRYNVQLKDDKNFLSLRLSTERPFPRLEIVRRRKKDGARYFGPYSSATAIRHSLRFINRHFQLRTCTDTEFRNRVRPCLEHQIKRCPAPCVLDVPTTLYDESVRQVGLFLSGQGAEVMGEVRTRMNTASKEMDFERATQYRDQLHAIERALEKQSVALAKPVDLDVFGIAREGPAVAVHLQEVRGGIIQRARAFKLGKNEAPEVVILGEFLLRYYGEERSIPSTVLLPFAIDDQLTCAQWLSDQRHKTVAIQVPARGERKHLIDGAVRNALQVLHLDQRRGEYARDVLGTLQTQLKLTRFPERIECYDISNFQGTDPVASMVVFIDGIAEKGEYRRFHIRSKNTPDDYTMMVETLKRRFARMNDPHWEGPDLVVVDGGKGQLNVARRVLQELNIDHVDLMGLAKSRVRESDDKSATVDRSPERVFMPNIKDPIVLRQNSEPLHLLVRIRDEAHRFAITFHKKTRRKKRLTSQLDSVEGLGPKRQQSLLKHFGSVAAIRRATVAELTTVTGISKILAERIRP